MRPVRRGRSFRVPRLIPSRPPLTDRPGEGFGSSPARRGRVGENEDFGFLALFRPDRPLNDLPGEFRVLIRPARPGRKGRGFRFPRPISPRSPLNRAAGRGFLSSPVRRGQNLEGEVTGFLALFSPGRLLTDRQGEGFGSSPARRGRIGEGEVSVSSPCSVLAAPNRPAGRGIRVLVRPARPSREGRGFVFHAFSVSAAP